MLTEAEAEQLLGLAQTAVTAAQQEASGVATEADPSEAWRALCRWAYGHANRG